VTVLFEDRLARREVTALRFPFPIGLPPDAKLSSCGTARVLAFARVGFRLDLVIADVDLTASCSGPAHGFPTLIAMFDSLRFRRYFVRPPRLRSGVMSGSLRESDDGTHCYPPVWRSTSDTEIGMTSASKAPACEASAVSLIAIENVAFTRRIVPVRCSRSSAA
jgi:hypothetical protein